MLLPLLSVSKSVVSSKSMSSPVSSIGLEPVQKNRVVNLRALSKSSKNKIDKKSGRNQPRANDYEIEFEPAPDSAFSLNTPLKQTWEKTPSTVGIYILR